MTPDFTSTVPAAGSEPIALDATAERAARRQAETARDDMAAILERITDAFFGLDAGWRFTYVNGGAERLLARGREALLGRNVWAEFPEAVGSTFQREYERAMREGTPVEFTEFFPPLDTWFEVKAYPSGDGLSVYFRDVSAQRAMAEALARSQRRLELALEASRQGTFEWEIATGKVAWSAAIERMHGIPVGSFDGTFEMWAADIHPDDRDRVFARVQDALSRGEGHHLHYRIVRPDGEVRWLDAHGHFELDARGAPARLVGVCRDVTEERGAEEALRRERYIMKLVTDNATSALFMMDRDGHPTFMNPAAERMSGYTLAEVRGFPLHYAVHHRHPDGSLYPMSECPIDRALPERAGVAGHEDIFVRKDGTFFPVVCAALPIIEGDEPVGTVVEVRDVTEERANAERLRVLAEAIPVHVWTADPTGKLDYVSGRTVEYFGATEAALLGDGWAALVHPDDLPAAGACWAHALATGEPYEVEFRLRRHDGTYRWHLARALPVRDARGAVSRWYGTNTDVDDKRAAEAARDAALAEAEAARHNLLRVFEQAPAAISVTEGPEHVMVVQNQYSRALVSGRDFTGKSVREALPELEPQGFFAILDEVYRTGTAFTGREVPAELPQDGGAPVRGYFDVVYQPLRDALGRVTGILSHSVEVTAAVEARRELERRADELARLAAALERSNRELDQFAYVTSHDLKAPLRGIANLAQWIEEDAGAQLAGEAREHLRLLQGRVHRMEALIDGILAFSRAARVRANPERVDTDALLRESVELLAPPAGVTVELPAPLPVLYTERTPLQQVLLNLVGNAIKHARAGGVDDVRVTVAAHDAPDPAMVEFTVADNGPGIAPEFHERIWGIFQTLEARDKVEGTGIGLSVVRKLVEGRGGHAWVESEPGAGATFHFTWPREQATVHEVP